MSYTPAQMDAATAALVAAVHGLHPDVARAWATAEQGVDFNILGVTWRDSAGVQHLFRYTSWAEGAQAAANLVANGPYAGIRAALAGGSSRAQAAAIIASPWNHPYYSGGAGAAALRAIAASSPPAAGQRWALAFHGATPVYAAPGGAVVGTVYSMAAVAEQALVAGAWWYRILSARLYAGRWVRANGQFTAVRTR